MSYFIRRQCSKKEFDISGEVNVQAVILAIGGVIV